MNKDSYQFPEFKTPISPQYERTVLSPLKKRVPAGEGESSIKKIRWLEYSVSICFFRQLEPVAITYRLRKSEK